MSNDKQVKHRLKWFLNRVGKVVYRNTKKKIGIGIMVLDIAHAEYLLLSQNELNLFYYD